MDLTSPKILKLKGALFLFLGVLSGALLLFPDYDPRRLVLFAITLWAFCRAYYFCFYVLHHYADPSFRYAGLWSIVQYLFKKTETLNPAHVMLHHLSFAVADLARSAKFYDAALAPLGYGRVWSDDTAVGYGTIEGQDKFAIRLRPHHQPPPGDGFHVAFSAPSQEAAAAFYEAALAHGGQDNGAPSLCPEYGPGYYAAFVIDPDGYRIEAVIIGAA